MVTAENEKGLVVEVKVVFDAPSVQEGLARLDGHCPLTRSDLELEDLSGGWLVLFVRVGKDQVGLGVTTAGDVDTCKAVEACGSGRAERFVLESDRLLPNVLGNLIQMDLEGVGRLAGGLYNSNDEVSGDKGSEIYHRPFELG